MDITAHPVIHDVWSRTGPKYRTRAVVLLIANMILFGALCCFMYWLRTGWYFPPTSESYAAVFLKTLNIAGDSQVTLYSLLTSPISLKLVPIQAVVIGLLIASLVSIPILVSILYRWPSSLPFCAMVSCLAVMPWLGATLVLSCALAAWSRTRVKFRFVAAMIGLAPIGVYFFTASQNNAPASDVLMPQIERGLVVAPLLLSAIASCTLMATVLSIAKIVDYRPGAIAPLLAVMFLTPWFVFVSRVGRDELHYRLLERHYGPRSKEFFASPPTEWGIRQVAIKMRSEPDCAGLTDADIEERVEEYFASQLDPAQIAPVERASDRQTSEIQTVLWEHRYRVAWECRKFRNDFPKSRYVPGVLFIEGRAGDMRVDISTFKRIGKLVFYDDFPREQSRQTWQTLIGNYPNSPLADVARYRLAQLDTRAGKVDEAIQRLIEICRPATDDLTARRENDGPRSLAGLFRKEPPGASLEDEYIGLRLQATRLLNLIQHNREPAQDDAPLVAVMKCVPRHRNYIQNLKEIVERFPSSKIEDNILVKCALIQPFATLRIAELREVQAEFPEGDTAAEILFELAMAYLEENNLPEANRFFAEVLKYPESSFAAAARRRLPAAGLGG